MFPKIKTHIQEKKHPYTVIAVMLLMISGVYLIDTNIISDNTVAIAVQNQVAQVSYTPLQPLPGAPAQPAVNMIGYLQNIIFLVIGIAIVLAVLMLVIGGVQYMASDAFTSKEDARDRMTMALFGLIIAFGAYLLLNTINPDLVTFRLPSAIVAPTPPSLPPPPPPLQEQIQKTAQGIPGTRVNLRDRSGRLVGAAAEVLDPTKNDGAVLKVDIGLGTQNKTKIAETFEQQCGEIATASGKLYEIKTTGIVVKTHTCTLR